MSRRKHLIVLFADHFEPDSAAQVREWVGAYASIAAGHRDADGKIPQHTWFYWGEKPDELAELKSGCDRQLGEVEIHLHHKNDTAEMTSEKLLGRLRLYQEIGLRARDVRARYAFAHGYWSLDNVCGNDFCGVNNELQVLKETGCFADFTFPGNKRSQPAKYNSIYYATDDPQAPKSFDSGRDVEVGVPGSGDLMMFQGPGRRSGYSRIGALPGAQKLLERLFVYADISREAVPTEIRIRNWVRQNVCVLGKPEWVFVKVHMHGARRKDYPVFFGKTAQRMYQFLQREYNDGERWKLHYVTAREAYNIVKAAEQKNEGDPSHYRDYSIAPYTNSMSVCL